MNNPEGFSVPSLAQKAAERSGLSANDFGPKGTLRETDPDRANTIGYDAKELAEDANYHDQQARYALDHRLSLEDQVLDGSSEVTEAELLRANAKESALQGIAKESNTELSEAEKQAGQDYDSETIARAA
jgi:hypothetical protein